MRRTGDDLRHDAADLGQLVHQPHLVVQTPRRVDEHHVGPVRNGRAERVESDRCGVGTHVLPDHRRARPLGPDGQLVDRRSTERIGRADVDLAARSGQLGRQLADGRRLACAVDPHDHQHVRRPFGQFQPEILGRSVRLLHQRRDLVAQDAAQFGRVHVLVARDALLDAADDLDGRLDPHVGGDEHLLQIVQHLGVDRRAARYGTRQFREKARLGAFQSGVQLLAPLFGLCFDSRPGGSIGRRILFLSEQIEKSHNKIGFSRTTDGLLHGCIAPRFRPAGIYSCDKDNNYSQN